MPKQTRVSFYLPIVLAVLIFLGWLLYTPNGVMGKADAVGYAVCHRIEERSFLLGERPMPLCARCSGMYLGALLAMVYQQPWRKWGGLPSRTVWVVVGIFLVLFGVDGLNSYLHLFPLAPHVYPPANWLRLVTWSWAGLGTGHYPDAAASPVLRGLVDRPAFSSGDPRRVYWQLCCWGICWYLCCSAGKNLDLCTVGNSQRNHGPAHAGVFTQSSGAFHVETRRDDRKAFAASGNGFWHCNRPGFCV